ncbi:glycoside hydrolase family 15 protein [Micromonospora purpureochromogenes]|uniref:GH15 family glucan-1,4-alpha-glucosidase n=1 Tax=Micromonospora purpureochromogenes TaxID=47872 RepID=A0ABX2RTQ2_9ACTN|nr:glycoside hydrolase family 15 protein [Micromonospora purpureochromogenes]NYF59910.1 GH15 family glucan-1,4-alpha-glucosidase [Micromonospora purpureochromogenes]
MGCGRIAEHGFLADGRSAVLVDRAGSVNWWCPARFDSPSVFTRLLDDDAGHWVIRPEGEFSTERAYLTDTLVLRTVFTTATGSVAVTDALALEPGARGHEVGLHSPRVLARVVRGLSGEVPLRLHYRPRFEYGRMVPQLVRQDDAWVATAASARLDLRTAIPLVCEVGEAFGSFTVRAGETRQFTLAYAPAYDAGPPAVLDAEQVIDNAVAGWRSWMGLHDYRGLHREQVRRSALVVQGMTYRPSGAVVAAPTMSLPEELGGERNYDYRYAWVRDFSFTLEALWRVACTDEVNLRVGWLARSMGMNEGIVPIMYGVEGERDLTEHHLEHLSGFAGSRPVLVGNDAWRQRQNDVSGEALSAAWLMREHLDPMPPDVRQLLRAMTERAARDWHLPDAGMWEARDAERHYVSSKVQCWTALDRAVRFGSHLGSEAAVARWAAARDEVRRAVLTQGWNDRLAAFTAAFDTDELDASVLLMPLVGFLPADDPRMRSTIRTIEERLSHDGLLRRWEGDPAGFVICSFWLVSCLALAGERDRAGQLFDRLADRVNDLGLFAEQIDPYSGEALGNFPQTFSHIGLINAAGDLTDVDAGRHPLPPAPERLIPAVQQSGRAANDH